MLSVSRLAKDGLVVKFVDERRTLHDLNDDDVIVASSSLCPSLYRLDAYDKWVNDATYSILDTQVIFNENLWHAHFGHLNFSSMLRLHKNDRVLLLSNLEAPKKHVCEGLILV